jgi:small nuclear ribonucleoprotein (snRNP)-like protein
MMSGMMGIPLVVVIVVACFAGVTTAAAETVAIEGVQFRVSQSLTDNLKPFVGKMLYVHLRSGQTLLGSLKAVGDHWIHLEKVAERNFFDAFIRSEDISAVEAQFRANK